MQPLAAFLTDSKNAPVHDVLGSPTRVLIDGAATGGAYALVEVPFLPDQGVPLHVHAHEDETFMVLEGEIEVTVAGTVHRVRAGEACFAPRGLPHTPWNRTSTPALVRVLITPAGFEQFFAEVPRLKTDSGFDMPAVMKLLERLDCRFL